MASAQGFATQVGTDSSSSTVTERFDFVKESVQKITSFHYPNTIVGSRDYPGELIVPGTYTVGGQLELQPNSVVLDKWLPRILGANEATDVFALAETLPTFYYAKDIVSKVMVYDGMKVNQAVFAAQSGGPVTLTMDLLGLTETVGNSGTFPSLSIDTSTGPYMAHSITTATVGGSAITMREISITINNMLDSERFLFSQSRVSLPEQDRMIEVALTVPYGDSSAFYGLSTSGVASVFTFTNGNRSLSFAFAKIHYVAQTPVVDGKGEIWLPLHGRACKSGSTASLIVTNDSSG